MKKQVEEREKTKFKLKLRKGRKKAKWSRTRGELNMRFEIKKNVNNGKEQGGMHFNRVQYFPAGLSF